MRTYVLWLVAVCIEEKRGEGVRVQITLSMFTRWPIQIGEAATGLTLFNNHYGDVFSKDRDCRGWDAQPDMTFYILFIHATNDDTIDETNKGRFELSWNFMQALLGFFTVIKLKKKEES